MRALGKAPTVLFLAAALSISASFLIVPLFYAADKSPDGLVLFREAGDPDYLPQVSALADLKMGETSVREYAGTGVRAFPLAPFAIHAIFYRLAGSTGFLIADVFTVFLYAGLLWRLLIISGVARGISGILSLAVVSGTMGWLLDKVAHVTHHALPVLFWEFRFPRPSITQAAFVLFLIAAMLVALRPARPWWQYGLLGLSFSVVLQSDIYAAFDAAFVFGAVCIYAAMTTTGRASTMKRLCAAAGGLIIATLPFIYQQINTSPDLKRRWGAFFTTRYAGLLPAREVIVLTTLALIGAAILAVVFRRNLSAQGRIVPLALAAIALGGSVISGPASLAVLRQTIQIYHCQDQTELMLGYAILLGAGWLLTDLRIARWRMPAAAAATLATAFFVFNAYRYSFAKATDELPTAPSMATLSISHYKPDFRELHELLNRPEYAKAEVLGTLDVELSNWWQYMHRYVYLADLFNTTLPDSVVESRIHHFLRLAGTSSEEYETLLGNWYFLIRYVGCYKYQANSLFTPWPLASYSPAAQRRITATTWPHNIELPESEKARLLRDFTRNDSVEQAPDVLVLDKGPLRAYLHPEREARWRLAWSNRTFEVWVPANLRAGKSGAGSCGWDV